MSHTPPAPDKVYQNLEKLDTAVTTSTASDGNCRITGSWRCGAADIVGSGVAGLEDG